MRSGDERRSVADGPMPAAGLDAAAVARWRRVKAVFLEALRYPDTERAAFVAHACADEVEVRDEVLSLLASEREAGSFGEMAAAELLGVSGAAPPDAGAAPARLAPGTRLGSYELTAFLSAGGMGEVYRARHVLLGREVAIKTLGAQHADPQASRRLIREAQHAAHLDHPNICTIHEIGEAGGTPFIVMEYVNGRPLSELARAGPLPLDRALAFGIGIAGALAHAHGMGIVHRDLKSSNVVIDADGRPVVLDFGLSKRVLDASGAAAQETTITAHGALAGTITHMAPERLLGAAGDERSDVWSLGVVLYELATGELPFQGRTSFETTSAILGEAPRPMTRRVPLALRLVIERCLVKSPDARYQRAADVRDALEAIRRRRAWPLVGRLLISARRRTVWGLAAAGVLAIPLVVGAGELRERMRWASGGTVSTLAVLPLENATGDPGAEYYAEGLTDALIGQLGSLGEVRIISRTSATRAALTAPTRAEIARQLDADVIVEGRLREASDRIVVDVRLIEPSRGRVLWSDSYGRSAGQVLALQADVVRALAAEIRLTLRPGTRERFATARAVTPEAYEAYLKGRFEWNRRTGQSLDRAIEWYTRAIELDPTYAPAHAALADCYNQFGTLIVGTGSPRDFRPRAAAAAIRALQIDPGSADAYATLGYVRHYDWAFEEAEQSFRRAIELNPSHALARIWYANLLMSRGRYDEALEQVRAARALDPFSLVVNTNVAWVLIQAGRHDEALADLERTFALDSTYFQAHWRRVHALLGAGRHAEAYESAQRMASIGGRTAPVIGMIAQAAIGLGRTEEARGLLGELLALARREYVPPGVIADVYAGLGDVDDALPWVERALDERANWAVYLPVDTAAGPLQRDARFQALVTRYGLR